jgi:hypothetical protein
MIMSTELLKKAIVTEQQSASPSPYLCLPVRGAGSCGGGASGSSSWGIYTEL